MQNQFLQLGINEGLVEVLNKAMISVPTPIQAQTIPHLLAGKDVLGQAQTGTGKTLAFMLPIMQKINPAKGHVQALIIAPTRELAIQITAEAKKLASYKKVNILAAYGGQDVEQQARKLKGAIHLIIGTPGRLLDHIERKTVHFSHLNMLVLDEADQMLNMGFLQEIEKILKHIPKEHQTMLFSATMPKGIATLSYKYMKAPERVKIESKRITLDAIKQLVIETTDRKKQAALVKTLKEENPFMAIIFCRTKRRASALNEALQSQGFSTDELHGDLSQAKREKVMKSFRNMEIQLLVATDVAARGLDIEGITHVFNYDVPQDGEDYIHRIGRTGRAGQKGVAITFVSPPNQTAMLIIEKSINMKIERRKIQLSETEDEERTPTAQRKHTREKVYQGSEKGKGLPKKLNNRGMPQKKKSFDSSHKSKGKSKGFGRKGTR